MPNNVATATGGPCPSPGSSVTLTRSTSLAGTPSLSRATRAISPAVPRSSWVATPSEGTIDHLRQCVTRGSRHADGVGARSRGEPDHDDQTHRPDRPRERERADAGAPRGPDAQPGALERGRRSTGGPEHRAQRSAGAHERQRPEHGHLGRVLGRLRSDQEHGQQADRGAERAARLHLLGHGLRIGDHEEEEDEDLGREHQDPPELGSRDRAQVPARDHRVAGRGEQRDPGREDEPERDRETQQVEATQDREAADHDQRDRQREPGGHRPPPEVERLGAQRTEQEETDDEADVGRVEDVAAAPADQVLGQQREGRGPGEDPPPAHAPPVAVHGARDAEDERDAVPGQQRARGPHDRPLLPEGDRDLEHRAGDQGHQDLGDRETEVERDLPEDL